MSAMDRTRPEVWHGWRCSDFKKHNLRKCELFRLCQTLICRP